MKSLENSTVRKVLAVLEAGSAMPSGIVRGLIYKDFFEKKGIQIKYVSRVSPTLLRLQQSPPSALLPLMPVGLGWLLKLVHRIIRIAKQFYIIKIAKEYDVVYLSKSIVYNLISKLRQKAAKPIVIDFGDAVWLPEFGVKKFNETLAMADAVTTDNEYTAAYVRRINPNCTVIPDFPQVEIFDRHRSEFNKSTNSKIRLGWIGSAGRVNDLLVIWEVLERLFAKYDNLQLRLVGVGSDPQNLPPFQKVKYSYLPSYNQEDMIRESLQMDIGLFPLQDDEAGRVRGILKALVYMAGETAVVCSAVGQNEDFIQDGTNGMLARSPAEWEEKIDILISDSGRRRQIARTGLELVRKKFTIEQSFSKLLTVLQQVSAQK